LLNHHSTNELNDFGLLSLQNYRSLSEMTIHSIPQADFKGGHVVLKACDELISVESNEHYLRKVNDSSSLTGILEGGDICTATPVKGKLVRHSSLNECD